MSAGLVGRPAAGIDDRAEQQQLRAGEAVADLDLARRDVGHQHRLVGGDQQRREQARSEDGEARALTDIRSRRFRRAARRGRAPCASATSRMITASARRSRSGLIRVVSSAPYWAPITPPTSSRPASTISTDARRQRMDHGRRGADREDHDQAGADDHARRHAEQIDHRRNQDEPAADAEEDGQHAGDEAERQRRDGRNVEARAVEAPAQRQRGDPAVVARRRAFAGAWRRHSRARPAHP